MILINGKIPTKLFDMNDWEAGATYYGINVAAYKAMVESDFYRIARSDNSGTFIDPEEAEKYDTH